jgi:DNA gyrase subunit A
MAYMNVRTLADEDYINNNYIILCTRNGIIKKTSLEQYSRPRVNGVNAITVREGDELLEARLTNGNHEIILAVKTGKAIRFNEKKVRAIGRTASGVKGVDLEDGDEVIGMICVEPNTEKHILVVSENGYGKRSDIDDYRITNRGAKGVRTMNITDKTGSLVAIKDVIDSDDLMIITKSGLMIRSEVSALRVMGRNTQGVKLINLRKNDRIGAVTAVAVSDEERLERENEKLEAEVVLDENGNIIEGILETEGETEGEATEPTNEVGENPTEVKPTDTEND